MADTDFSRKLELVDRAVAEVERLATGEGLEAARKLLAAVLDAHKEALEDLVGRAEGAERELLAGLARRPKVAWLFGLHGVNPRSLAERANEALGTTSGALPGGARARLLSVDGESVRVLVEQGSDEARRLLARAVESALSELAPEAALSIEGVPPERSEPALIAVDKLVRRREVPSP